jgi:hypothetical protein
LKGKNHSPLPACSKAWRIGVRFCARSAGEDGQLDWKAVEARVERVLLPAAFDFDSLTAGKAMKGRASPARPVPKRNSKLINAGQRSEALR